MPRYVMLIDSALCMNCKACVVACQQRNGVPYGFSRNWIRAHPDPEAPFGARFQPGACMHCADAPCVRACPTAATWQGDDGAVLTDTARCIGCGACIAACPYEARFRHPETRVADKCDYCLASGGEPACVSICPVGCRIFGDADDPASPAAQALASRHIAHVLPEGQNPRPTLAYLDGTAPLTIPPRQREAQPLDSLGPLAKTLTWVGGLTLAFIGGTFTRQLFHSSEKEEREMESEKKNSREDKK